MKSVHDFVLLVADNCTNYEYGLHIAHSDFPEKPVVVVDVEKGVLTPEQLQMTVKDFYESLKNTAKTKNKIN